MPFNDIVRTLSGVFYGFDEGAFKVAVATLVANLMEQRPHESQDGFVVEETDPLDPVWTLLVAPPSSGKTEAINLLSGLACTHLVLELTAKTLATGHKGAEHLLPKLTGKVVLIKDMSSIFSKRDHEIGELLDQFRQIYDGRIIFNWGSGKEPLDWRGKIGLIAGCTEDIFDRHKVISEMGDRFMYMPVQYFHNPAERRRVASAARRNGCFDGTLRRDLRERVHNFVNSLVGQPLYSDEVEVSEEVGHVIDTMAEFATRARGYVPRDFHGEVAASPQLEGSGRMAKSLDLVVRAMGIVNQTGRLARGDLSIVRRLAFGGTKPIRREILMCLRQRSLQGQREYVGVSTIAAAIRRPRRTVVRALEDLVMVGLLDQERVGSGDERTHRLYQIRPYVLRDLDMLMRLDRAQEPAGDGQGQLELTQHDGNGNDDDGDAISID